MIKEILDDTKLEDHKLLIEDISKDINADVLQAEIFLKEIQDIITDLKDTLSSDSEMESLSANQIGYKKKIFVARDINNQSVINTYIDPVIIKVYPNKIKVFTETCSSLPNKHFITMRYSMIKAIYYDEFGKYHKTIFRNIEAAMFQHELDHLYGILVKNIAENTTS